MASDFANEGIRSNDWSHSEPRKIRTVPISNPPPVYVVTEWLGHELTVDEIKRALEIGRVSCLSSMRRNNDGQ